MKIITNSERKTKELGSRLARYLKKKDIVLLCGELGAGKTILAKGIARGLGINQNNVTSSSFVIMKEHKKANLSLYHFDLYRIENVDEILSAGLKEHLWGGGISVIEWAQKFRDFFDECIQINISIIGKDRRAIRIIPYGIRYKKILGKIENEYFSS